MWIVKSSVVVAGGWSDALGSIPGFGVWIALVAVGVVGVGEETEVEVDEMGFAEEDDVVYEGQVDIEEELNFEEEVVMDVHKDEEGSLARREGWSSDISTG